MTVTAETEVRETVASSALTVTIELPSGFVAMPPVERERALELAMTRAWGRLRRRVAEQMHATYGRGPIR
jgi:hypothetical protein